MKGRAHVVALPGACAIQIVLNRVSYGLVFVHINGGHGEFLLLRQAPQWLPMSEEGISPQTSAREPVLSKLMVPVLPASRRRPGVAQGPVTSGRETAIQYQKNSVIRCKGPLSVDIGAILQANL